MAEQLDTPLNETLAEENKRLRLEVKKLSRQLNLANDNMIKYRSVTSAKENLSAVIAAEKSVQEKQLRVIMENSPDIIIILDSGQKFLLSTNNFLKLADVPGIGFLHHKSVRQVFSLFADESAILEMERILGMALETKEIQSSEACFYVGSGLDLRDYTISAIPFIYSGEKNDGLLVIFHDITERKEMEYRITKALGEAMIASKAKGDFLSNMSHEMRTPMNAIIGMTAVGKKAEALAEKNNALDKIGNAASHLLGIINDVLDMAKIEADKLELAPIEYNLEEMLHKVATVINFRLDEKRQKFTVYVDNTVPRFIVGDDQRLAQVIANLLSNAVKFTPEGGDIGLRISLVAGGSGETMYGEKSESYTAPSPPEPCPLNCDTAQPQSTPAAECELLIEVTDSGIGISQENQEKLFHAFEQAESGTSRRYGGTGLGLVISKRIIELMGGKIWVESESGKGSRFVFTIKARRGSTSTRSLLLPGVNWKNVRIMAVDDMVEIRNQFTDLFSHLEIKCDVAADGFEACRIIEESGRYDIYFVDWQMPGMDGIELTRRIKSGCVGRQPVVIMITALEWDGIREEAMGAGVDKHLFKPLFSSTIIDCINECLGVDSSSPDMSRPQDCGRFEGKKLLLAEDIEINREILMALLDGTGMDIDCAENGQEALGLVEADPCKYDIVFMDMQMPKMDGLEATRRIRKLPALKDSKLPIIAMTANVFKDDIEACIEAGMDDHIGKPLDIDRVIEKLNKYL